MRELVLYQTDVWKITKTPHTYLPHLHLYKRKRFLFFFRRWKWITSAVLLECLERYIGKPIEQT